MSMLENVLDVLDLFKDYKKQPDYWLVEKVINGDKEAYSTLFERYQSTIVKFARVKFGKSSDAQDVSQHCFLQLFLYPNSFRGKNLKGYFFSIAINYIREEYNMLKFANVSVEEEREKGFDLGVDEKILQNLISEEFSEFVEICIKELNEDYQTVCYMYYLERMKMREIAEILGISSKRVANILYICRKEIELRLLEKYGRSQENGE